jgi:hypothetical protein
MITICNDLYVVINELPGDRAPQPRPLANGFGKDMAYRVLGLHSASETSEAYLILSNNQDQIWYIPNRHVRTHGVFPGNPLLRFLIEKEVRSSPVKQIHRPLPEANRPEHYPQLRI